MIVTIQFRTDVSEQHEQECIRRRLPADSQEEVRFYSVFDQSVDFAHPEQLLHGATKLILGGSGEFALAPGHPSNDYTKVAGILHTVEPLVRYVLEQDFPTLGLCFGHQIIGHFAGCSVEKDPNQSETGSFPVTLTPVGEQDPLFHSMPSQFNVIVGHHDSLATVPHGATLLARSERCIAQALRYGQYVYTTQFHSELDDKDLQYRLNLYPAYRDHGENDSLTLPPSPDSVTPLRHFLELS
jgi:GMP synthase (glutamine-hydrolysing)